MPDWTTRLFLVWRGACRAPGSVLASLDLEGNDAGPKACEQLAETIAQTSLKALSLEGNNLTQGGEDGFHELCKGLRSSSLTRLSLWRCNLPQSCGPCLAEGVGPLALSPRDWRESIFREI